MWYCYRFLLSHMHSALSPDTVTSAVSFQCSKTTTTAAAIDGVVDDGARTCLGPLSLLSAGGSLSTLAAVLWRLVDKSSAASGGHADRQTERTVSGSSGGGGGGSGGKCALKCDTASLCSAWSLGND